MHYSANKTVAMSRAAPSQKKRLAFADGLRGFAALWVVLFHMAEGGHIENIKDTLPNILFSAIFSHGDLGVAIFFVLSGFVMALTVRSVHVSAVAAVKFLARRFIRLVPPYYFAIAFAIAVLFIKAKALGSGLPSLTAPDVAAHLFFVQDFLAAPEINTVFWTLCIEMQFYIAFAILFLIADYLARNKVLAQARYVLVLISAAIALLWPVGLISTPLWAGGFIMFWYSFLAGVLSCWACSDAGSIRLYAYGYGLLIMLIGLITSASFPLIVGFTAILLIYAGTKEKMTSWLSWSWIQFLGLISYSLYLLHNPITGATSWLVQHWFQPGLLTDIASLLVALVCCLLASWLAFMVVERSSIQWSHAVSMKLHKVKS